MGEPPTPALSVFWVDEGKDFQNFAHDLSGVSHTGREEPIGAFENSVNSLIKTQINELSIIWNNIINKF